MSFEYFREIVRDPNKFVVIVEEDGKVIAVTLLCKVPMLSRVVMTYDDLVVDPDYRGRGIGKEIDKFLIELAKRKGCDCIELVVPTGAVAVQRQHLKTGFTFRTQLAMGMVLKQWEPK